MTNTELTLDQLQALSGGIIHPDYKNNIESHIIIHPEYLIRTSLAVDNPCPKRP